MFFFAYISLFGQILFVKMQTEMCKIDAASMSILSGQCYYSDYI